ncbi:MAG: hypothetical protein IPL10_19740 [Bacteroidetes bacterium]|nr:hypothetical protein [Bacteroidota bacterium]
MKTYFYLFVFCLLTSFGVGQTDVELSTKKAADFMSANKPREAIAIL